MPGALTFREIVLKGGPEPVSFSVAAGTSAVLVSSGQAANEQIVRFLLCLERLRSGEIELFDTVLSRASEHEIRRQRERVGVVYSEGGLISNLKAWENLVLPMEYRGTLSAAEISSRGEAILLRLGFDADVHSPVGTLSLYQKRLLGLGRAMLCDPDLLLVSGILVGLGDSERRNLVTIISAFQYEKAGRIILYITANPELTHEFAADQVIRLRGE